MMPGLCSRRLWRTCCLWGLGLGCVMAGLEAVGFGDEIPAAATELSWPQFRGPDGQGHAQAHDLPAKWNEETNIAWKTRLPGPGWSSPVVANGLVWLTVSTDNNRSLRLVAVDFETGAITRNFEALSIPFPDKLHPKNSHATPTPILQDDRIYVHFGAYGTASFRTNGEQLWSHRLNYYHHHGPGASPVLCNGRLIVPCDGYIGPFYDRSQRSDIPYNQYVAALNAETGEVDWLTQRAGEHSYCTPLVIEAAGRTQVISPGGNSVSAFDPATGEEIWTVRYQGYSVVPRPVFAHGLVYVCTGYNVAQLLAIRPDGTGDVTRTHVAWSYKTSVPFTPSPLVQGERLWLINDAGILTCLNALTGKLHWKRRLGGNFSASPLLADDKLLILAEDGTQHVLDATSEEYRRLSVNKLSGTFFASPAALDDSWLLRSDKALYRIRQQPPEPTR